MNDLAEKALEGLDVARREVRGHPMLSLAVSGFAVGALVVVSGGRAGAVGANRPLTSWFGLQDVRSAAIGSTPGTIMLLAVLTLLVLWIAAFWLIGQSTQPLTRVWWVAGAWALPFVAGPPLMDTSVYTYVAYGRIQRSGRDPYLTSPVAVLGDSRLLTAIDPGTRGLASSAGPLGSLLQHLVISVSSGTSLTAVVVWRAIGVVAAAWMARSAAELAGPRRTSAVAACALNPLVLLYAVSSPHLDAVMAALVLSALVAARERRWWRALALASIGGSVLAPGLVAVVMIAAVHWFGRKRRSVWPVAVRDVLVVGVTLTLAVVLQPNGLGWLRTARYQFAPQEATYSIAGAAQKLIALVVRVASYDDLAAGARLTAALAALGTIVYLLVTSQLRPLEASVGYALLAVALLAPVLNPWYLLWGVLCLLPTATGQLRVCLVGLSAAGCILAPPGFVGRPADVVTGVCLGVIALGTAVAVWVVRPVPTDEFTDEDVADVPAAAVTTTADD